MALRNKVAIRSLPARSPAEPGPERPAAKRQGAGKMALRKEGAKRSLLARLPAEQGPERPAAKRQGVGKMAPLLTRQPVNYRCAFE